jgi:hypothetical protein
LQKISYLPVSNFRKYICPAYIFSWQLYHTSFVSRIVNSVGDKYIYILSLIWLRSGRLRLWDAMRIPFRTKHINDSMFISKIR